jgi:DNA replication protein DnaC
MLGYRAQYWRVTRLLEELDLAKADGRYLGLVKSLAKFKLLILDDWAMTKLQGQHQQLLLDVLDDRYQKTSTIITSQLPVAAWYAQIHMPIRKVPVG